jgi:magnesium transporter
MTERVQGSRRFLRKLSQTAGLSPGTLVHVGEKKLERACISAIVYDADYIFEQEVKDISEIGALLSKSGVKWIDVDGVHDLATIEKLGQELKLHPLILEDIANTEQRTKLEDYGDILFIVARWFDIDKTSGRIVSDQISLILGRDFVISFSEKEVDEFTPVRQRIREGQGRIRAMCADYLLYRLMDSIVDNYYVVLEPLGERIDDLESRLLGDPSPKILPEIFDIKRDLLFLRKSVWPMREVLSSLERGESLLIGSETHLFLRDAYDHTIHVMDTIDIFRDMESGSVETYLSSLSYRQNEVMRLLTIISTFFLPLTFLAGVWGMNFIGMPELKWPFGYAIAWGVMLVVAAGMVVYFRKKKWL